MTYAALDVSAQDGRPVFLYKFVQGVTEWHFTNIAFNVVFAGDTYIPAPISHSEINQTNELSKDSIKITMPRDNAFAAQFLGFAPDVVTSVTVLRGHLDDGEFVTYWKGRVASAKVVKAQINIECESIFTSMRRPGLRAKYLRTCRHAHYSRGCLLDPETFAEVGTITAITGLSLTITEASGFADGYFTGGMIRASDTSLRLISNHVGSTITISRPADNITAGFALNGYGNVYGQFYGGASIKLYPGCDHTKAICISKFNNLENFGGMPYIPLKNPFGGSSIV
jgi:uncharacterized phage protein (TIGR02218 family)